MDRFKRAKVYENEEVKYIIRKTTRKFDKVFFIK